MSSTGDGFIHQEYDPIEEKRKREIIELEEQLDCLRVGGVDEEKFNEAKSFVRWMYIFGILTLPFMIGLLFLGLGAGVDVSVSEYTVKRKLLQKKLKKLRDIANEKNR